MLVINTTEKKLSLGKFLKNFVVDDISDGERLSTISESLKVWELTSTPFLYKKENVTLSSVILLVKIEIMWLVVVHTWYKKYQL